MDEREARNCADEAARNAGWDLDSYLGPTATLSDTEWFVYYQMKPPARVGGHFSVYVDDATGRTRLVPGR